MTDVNTVEITHCLKKKNKYIASPSVLDTFKSQIFTVRIYAFGWHTILDTRSGGREKPVGLCYQCGGPS